MSDAKDPLVPEAVAAGARVGRSRPRKHFAKLPSVEEGLDHHVSGAPSSPWPAPTRSRPSTSSATWAGRASTPTRAGSSRPAYRGKALDDAAVRGVRHREADERALPLSSRSRPDRPVDGLSPADALRLRLGPLHVARRGRQVRRRDRLPARHGDALRRHRPRASDHVDDDQLARRRSRSRCTWRSPRSRVPPGTGSAARSRTTSSRSTSPRRSGSSRRGPRCGWSRIMSPSARSTSRSGTRSRSPATTSGRRARPPLQELAFTLATASST